MKRIKNILFLILLAVCFLPAEVNASHYHFVCENHAEMVAGGEATCYLHVASSDTALSFDLEYNPDMIEVSSFEPSSEYTYTSNGNSYSFTRKTITLRTDVVVMKFKAKKTTSLDYTYVNFKNIKVSNEAKEDYTMPVLIEASNTYIKDLGIDSESIQPAFDKNVFEYNVVIRNNQDTVKVLCDKEDPKANFVEGFECGKDIPFTNSTGDIRVQVKAQDGTVGTYTFHVSRAASTLDANNYLSSLSLSAGALEFDKNTNSYTVTVGPDVDTIDVNATPESAVAKVSVTGSGSLNYGSNIINVDVTSETGATRNYVIIVVRTSELVDVNEFFDKNTNLSSLAIEGYELEFKKDVLAYNLKIGNVSELKITAVPETEKSQVVIIGNNTLVNGSIVHVVVVSESGDKKDYTITIEKDEVIEQNPTDIPGKDDNTPLLIVAIVAVVVLILGAVGFVVYKRKKETDKPVTKLDENTQNPVTANEVVRADNTTEDKSQNDDSNNVI